MSNIRWDELFYVNPVTGDVSQDPQPGFIPAPNYGIYGGPFNPEEPLLTKPNGDPYSYNKLLNIGDITQDPVDIIDYYFYVHDAKLLKAGPGYNEDHALADINLIQSLTLTDTSYDPEASLYDGFVTLALIDRLVINDQLDAISPTLLWAALTDAANDIEYGLQHLPADEQLLALETIFGPSDNGVYQLEFTFPSIPGASELQNELVELSAITAVAAAINEQGDMPVLTFGGDDYILRFDTATSDLDILAADQLSGFTQALQLPSDNGLSGIGSDWGEWSEGLEQATQPPPDSDLAVVQLVDELLHTHTADGLHHWLVS